MSSATGGSKSKRKLNASSASKHGIPPEKERSCVSNIMDIPNEIWIKIILFLNARERVRLGNSCKRLNSLIFEDAKLLRNLDFSKEGHLTSASDVQQYFNNENSCAKVLRVNVRNTDCMKPGRMLNAIGKARNLVDINIHGIKFQDYWQLGAFLSPLLHVQRLSFDWSESSESRIPMCCKVLRGPFSRLKYLSVKMKVMDCVKVFIPSLQLCKKLEELCMVVEESHRTNYRNNFGGELRKLNNLKVVKYCGPLAMQMKELFGTLIPNPEKWADFRMNISSDPKGFYLAFVDDCEEVALLADSALLLRKIRNNNPGNRSNSPWTLTPEILLKEVLEITHENVPEELCCLSTFMNKQRCLLKIEEAKMLLKNPRSDISYLYIDHPVELGCDVHLLASAFSNLTELQLASVTRNVDSFPKDAHFQRRLRKRGEKIPEELVDGLNVDSSFKMLIENTPHLRHFTLGRYSSTSSVASSGDIKNWDLEELYLIPKWKNLQSLYLICVPITDGEFLIEIGKQCKNLQDLGLINLGPRDNCCYEEELLQMLTNCQNLRDFLIEAPYLEKTSEILSLLANNVHLSRVEIVAKTVLLPGSTHITQQQSLASSIERLLHQCLKLTTFVGDFGNQSGGSVYQFSRAGRSSMDDCLSSIPEGSKAALNRPDLQILIRRGSTTVGTVFSDSPHFNPFPEMRITN